MTEAVIAYERELPEVPGRVPWEPPTSYLVKDDNSASGWRVEDSGRRPSQLLLVPKIREAVDAWRAGGYEGGSEVTRRLFQYWFHEDHEVPGFDAPFRYYFCQREAIETLAWLVEIADRRDAKDLIETYSEIFQRDLISKNVEFQTTMDGRRQIRRYVAGSESVRIQDLPPEDLSRFAFKMATGSGKTWVMAMALVWCRFHRQRVPDSRLSSNFLVVAPNVIVYQRLEKDFANNRIFHELPLIPPEWKGGFSQKVILRGEATEHDPSGNLFLTNIHQLYESRETEWTPTNAVDALLGKKPAQNLAVSSQRSMLERVKSLPDLVVMNDEAHHVHDEDLAWTKSLLAIHQNLPRGINAWLDFSATPKDQNGMYFPWTVCDYPLAQAVEDRIVKAPLIVTNADDPTQPAEDPRDVKKANVVEKHGYWLRAAVSRWQEHHEVYKKLSAKPVLFIMTEKNVWADAIGEYLHTTEEFGFHRSEILVIHTDNTGEVRKADIERARQEARDIDLATSRIKVIVSVLMLREGWDVRNVTVVLGLRPFTAKAEILPEQVIGRGLRLMSQVSPDRTQTLEVLGTPNLLDTLRNKLEVEGVGVVSTKKTPPLPITIEPVQERLDYDIVIPIPKLSLTHNVRKLSSLDVNSLHAILDREDIDEAYRMRLRMEFAPTDTEVHQVDIAIGDLPPTGTILAGITNKVVRQARLTNQFAELFPTVQAYVLDRCFGRRVDPDDDVLRSHLNRLELQEGIARYLAAEIANLTIERRPIEFDEADSRLSKTRPFAWRRDLPPLEARKTVFNFVATYNSFERQFAEFLDRSEDVARFAALGTTEQGSSGAVFRVDYLKPSGAIGFYYPDWVVVQRTEEGEMNWIIETKGRVWEGTEQKDSAMRHWCQSVSRISPVPWQYFRVNQADFRPEASTLRQLLVQIIRKSMLTERDKREETMSRQEIREARDEGRA
jgi:type III restriction enzyme